MILLVGIGANMNKITANMKNYNTKKIVVDENLNKAISEFKNNLIEEFKSTMKSKHSNIKSINVNCSSESLIIYYTLNKNPNENERNLIFNETKRIMNEKSIQSSIQEESNRKNFFSHIVIILENPETGYKIYYETRNFTQSGSGVCNWNMEYIGKAK